MASHHTPQKKKAKSEDLPHLTTLFNAVIEGNKELLKLQRTEAIAPSFTQSVSLDQDTLTALEDRLIGRKSGRLHGTGETNLFIKYVDDAFEVRGKIIDFPDSIADHVLLLKALYFNPRSDGFMKYADIETYFKKELKTFEKEGVINRKRIHNAFQNLYRFRSTQKNTLPKKTSNGKPLISMVRGKGFIFQNPIIG